jgi:hypothetical protein
MSVVGITSKPRYDYHPASEFAGGKAGALWDFSGGKWRRTLFQDAAATIPITADGQTVGCIKNVLGDPNWDLIQANAGNKPTFRIIDGVPRIICGVGTGMYSRTVQSLVIPAFICCGMRHNVTGGTNGRVILGLYRNDNNYFYVSDSTLAALAADTTGVSPPRTVSRKTAVTAQYSCPPLSMDAVSGLINSAGVISVRQTDETVHGTDLATGWVAGDTVPTMTVNLNAGGQNGITRQPTAYNADATTDFFGGMILMGAEPQNREGCHHYFRRVHDPVEKPRSTDKIYAWNSDSTGDNQFGATVFIEPPFKIATDYFAPNHPEASVFYVEWSRIYDRLTGIQRLSTGTTDARIYVYNFAVSGSQPDYFLGERWARSIGALPHIDAFFVNHGQNLAVYAVTDPAGYIRRGDWFCLSEKLRKAFPTTPQLYVRAYEVNIAGSTAIVPVVTALDAVVATYGDGTGKTDVRGKFDADGNPSTYFQSDHVHPTALGVQAFTDRAGPDIMAFLAAPGSVSPPLINQPKVAASIGPNPLFATWADPSHPDSWTPVGVACAHSFEQVDAEKGDLASLKLVGNGYVEASFNLVPYRGLTLALYTRVFIPGATADLTSGRIQFLDDSPTSGLTHGNSWTKDFNAKPVDGWVGYTLCTKLIPIDATTGKIRLHAGGGAGTVAFFGRCVVSVGSTPRDLQQ